MAQKLTDSNHLEFVPSASLSANCKLCMVGTQMFLCYRALRGEGESGERRELSVCLPDPKAGWSVGSGA